MFQFIVDTKSPALQALDRLANLKTGALHKRISTVIAGEIQTSYLTRGGGRGGGTYNFYTAIKKAVGAGETRGMFTGSTLNAITGMGDIEKASIFLKGGWPGEIAKYVETEKDIPVSYLIETAISGDTYGLGKMISSELKMSKEEYAAKFAGVMAHVKISKSGVSITYDEGAPDYLEDRFLSPESYATKTFETGPGVRSRKRMRDFMYMDEQQVEKAVDIVNQHLNKIIGASSTKVLSQAQIDAIEDKQLADIRAKNKAFLQSLETSVGRTSGPLFKRQKTSLSLGTRKAFKSKKVRDVTRPPKKPLSEIVRNYLKEAMKRYRRIKK